MLTIRLETSPPTNSISSFVDNPYVAVVGGTYRGSAGILVKETDCRYKIRLSTGREVYFKKENVKFDEVRRKVSNSPVHLPALVIGGTYRGSAGFLVKETDFQYKIRLSTGREVYLKKTNVKVQLDGDSGDVAKQLLKIQYHIDCLMDFFKQLDVTRFA
jgi:hypothetical protein